MSCQLERQFARPFPQLLSGDALCVSESVSGKERRIPHEQTPMQSDRDASGQSVRAHAQVDYADIPGPSIQLASQRKERRKGAEDHPLEDVVPLMPSRANRLCGAVTEEVAVTIAVDLDLETM